MVGWGILGAEVHGWLGNPLVTQGPWFPTPALKERQITCQGAWGGVAAPLPQPTPKPVPCTLVPGWQDRLPGWVALPGLRMVAEPPGGFGPRRASLPEGVGAASSQGGAPPLSSPAAAGSGAGVPGSWPWTSGFSAPRRGRPSGVPPWAGASGTETAEEGETEGGGTGRGPCGEPFPAFCPAGGPGEAWGGPWRLQHPLREALCGPGCGRPWPLSLRRGRGGPRRGSRAESLRRLRGAPPGRSQQGWVAGPPR